MNRQRQVDQLVAQMAAEIAPAPTDELLDRIQATDPDVYRRLGAGERWLYAHLDDYLAGELEDLADVRAGRRDWIALWRYAVALTDDDANGRSGSSSEDNKPDRPAK